MLIVGLLGVRKLLWSRGVGLKRGLTDGMMDVDDVGVRS